MGRARLDKNRAFYAAAGKKIRDARRQQRLTQDVLAARVSLTRTSIINIEKGKQQLLVHTLVQLAKELGVQPAELLPEIISTNAPDLNELLRDQSKRGREWIKSTIPLK
jgi:transcriptional regulator with XRE-family HTH domain